MDFLGELIFEIILEGVFGLTVENPKVKTWVKTTVYLLMAEGFAAAVALMSISAFRQGNTAGAIACGALAAIMAVGFLIGSIHGHRREWKQAQ